MSRFFGSSCKLREIKKFLVNNAKYLEIEPIVHFLVGPIISVLIKHAQLVNYYSLIISNIFYYPAMIYYMFINNIIFFIYGISGVEIMMIMRNSYVGTRVVLT